MEKRVFPWFRGIITDIRYNGCTVVCRVENEEGSLAEFYITPDTYGVHQVQVSNGMPIIGFYDGDAPMVLSYPPRYMPLMIARDDHRYNIALDYFDRRLLSADGTLQLRIGPRTKIAGTNGQKYEGALAGRLLGVLYGVSTRSIPAQVTPEEIIVFCKE